MKELLSETKSKIQQLRAYHGKLINQHREGKWKLLAIQESLKEMTPEGHRVKICGPVELDQKQYYINLIERKRLLKRRLIKVVVTDDKSNKISDREFIKKTIQTSVLAGLILNSKSNYPKNIIGSLSEIKKRLTDLKSISLAKQKLKGLEKIFLSVERNIDKVEELTGNLGKIYDGLAQSNVPSYETIASYEQIINAIRSQYLFLIQDCETLFEYEHNTSFYPSLKNSRQFHNIKAKIFFHLEMLKNIIKRLSNLSKRKQEYVLHFLSNV